MAILAVLWPVLGQIRPKMVDFRPFSDKMSEIVHGDPRRDEFPVDCVTYIYG